MGTFSMMLKMIWRKTTSCGTEKGKTMADLELVFNEESGVWEERPEPYIMVEIETEEEFEHLKAAIEFYKNRDKYEEVVRCKDCKHYVLHALACRHENFNGIIPMNGYCYYGERKDNATD
jgi:hypothetical protein